MVVDGLKIQESSGNVKLFLEITDLNGSKTSRKCETFSGNC
jgi:hypothetical protein